MSDKRLNGTLKIEPSISAYQLKDLTPKYRKKLQDAVGNSLAKVKGLSQKTMLLLKQRFRNWAPISKEELKTSLNDRTKKSEKHLQSVIMDQTRKVIGTMDKITADDLGAIGFIWRTRLDNQVVGNPSGKNPDVLDPKVHGNHYKREGVFYLYPDTWAVKKGYVAARDGVIFSDKLEDGLPLVSPGCRCFCENVYDLEDIPKEYESIITEKGKLYMRDFE